MSEEWIEHAIEEAWIRARGQLEKFGEKRQVIEARADFSKFVTYTFPRYRHNAFSLAVCAALEKCLRGEIKRLIINAPPQHGKSQLAAKHFPAFWLGHRPDDPVIVTSYGATLAERHSREARAIVESQAFMDVFPDVKTDAKSRAVTQWKLADPHRGSYLAVGLGGPITGHGGLLGIVDDPFENWEQAQSAYQRDLVWDWWRGTFLTRIWENGVIVLIMTRWHVDDLAGRLLEAEGIVENGGSWVLLRFPAIAETQEERDVKHRRMGLPEGLPDVLGRKPGEPLAPSRFSLDHLTRLRNIVGAMVWEAEYQGTPIVAEGNRFKTEWFEFVSPASVPDRVVRIRYWDKAATAEGQRGAYTAGVLMAYDRETGLFYVEDVVRGKWSARDRNEVMVQTAERDGKDVVIWYEIEPGSGGKESAEYTARLLAGYSVFGDRVTGSKDTRMEAFAAQAEARNIKIVRGAWNQAYLDELATVPNGPYRDQVDASVGAFNKLLLYESQVSMRQGQVHNWKEKVNLLRVARVNW